MQELLTTGGIELTKLLRFSNTAQGNEVLENSIMQQKNKAEV